MPLRTAFNPFECEDEVNKLQKIRNTCFSRQGGKCYYCRQPMWLNDCKAFIDRFGLSVRQARRHQATAEHLMARCDGGTDCVGNIVAACVYCNRRRHSARRALPPKAYGQHVRARLSKGKWHGFRLA